MESLKKWTLPKQFADKWLTALRSGEYQQTVETLYKPDKNAYCCLGVACHLQGIPDDAMDGIGEPSEIYEDQYPALEDFATEYSIPYDILKGNLVLLLIQMNDNEKMSFNEIADWIEANVKFI